MTASMAMTLLLFNSKPVETMKANKFFLAALAIAATASCQEDGLTGSEFTRETESATIISGADTKTSLNGKEIHWTSDDKIAVFDNTNYKNKFNITDCEGSYATFSGEVTTGTTQIYAVYPYELAVSASGSNLVVNIPTDQTSKAGSFAEEHNISVAKGVKTPGYEAIGDVTFQNVCALLKFTIPSYISDAHTVTLSSNSVIAGNMSVDCSGDSPACTISSEGSKSISMTGEYLAGSTFIFVLAPGTLDGFTVNVQTGMANWSISRTTQVALEAGKYKNLGTLELEQVSSASASASHTYSGNTLTGTNVTVNLNLPASTKQYITALNLEVKNAAGTVVRSVSKTAAAATETIGANANWPYLPQGKYTVSGTYTLSGNTTKEIAAISFTSPAPTFTVTSGAYSSYTKYINKDVTAANNCTADKIYAITTASVSIADAILNNSNYSSIKGGYTYTLDGAATTSTEVSGQSWGPHTVIASYQFDNVTKEGSSDCHITGLPYRATPPTSSNWSSSGSVKFRSGDVRFGNGGGEGSITMNLSVPGNVNISVSAKIDAYGAPVNTTTYVEAGGSRILSCKSNSSAFNYKTVTVEDTVNGTLTTSNSTIKAGTTYGLGTTQGNLYYLNVLYR